MVLENASKQHISNTKVDAVSSSFCETATGKRVCRFRGLYEWRLSASLNSCLLYRLILAAHLTALFSTVQLLPLPSQLSGDLFFPQCRQGGGSSHRTRNESINIG